ncbi:hypothetical protein AnigIFM63604_011053 [Aspergillus niger]|uniref:Major facilitator superfamily (MFS) profile domain-containing protein n=1 Tax=Aspergillus niger TaxID=5061 RepID=A0A9W6A9S4_ASPNG|nr:hypothetical protein CBS147346_7673 [Aspergillus niger]GLA29760.1 hypothetical protein AnigIFM63326_007674 [Aspergillus niger]GLA53751.1 hypothetical protein AnigIFM63604_011053 [Aspergillus niger]
MLSVAEKEGYPDQLHSLACHGHEQSSARFADSTSSAASPEADDELCQSFPEGGKQGWLCVFGSFMGLTGSLGLVNSIGTFQAFLETHQLVQYGSGSTGWIFGTFTFLTFFCGIQIGPIFDACGPRYLVFSGSLLVMAMMISLGFCTEFWQFFLSIGVAGGIGTSLIFTPAIAAIGHFFWEKRGLATGIAAGGGSVGGVIFPLVLESLFDKTGFAWATRVVALLCLVCLATGCLLITSRLPTKPFSRENIAPDLKILKEPGFLLTTLSVFFIEWGLFVPISYISSYALTDGVNQRLSYQLLAILNAGSFFGRLVPGYMADFIGRFNTLIITVALCLVCNCCFWLPAEGNVPLLITYCCLFGFSSGSNISLTPVCIGQLCRTEHYGRYYATAYTVVSISTLTGVPIAGEILTRCGGNYWGLILFTICCYAAGLGCAIGVKIIHCGWSQPWAKF